jgi:hypothetical protein
MKLKTIGGVALVRQSEMGQEDTREWRRTQPFTLHWDLDQ